DGDHGVDRDDAADEEGERREPDEGDGDGDQPGAGADGEAQGAVHRRPSLTLWQGIASDANPSSALRAPSPSRGEGRVRSRGAWHVARSVKKLLQNANRPLGYRLLPLREKVAEG